MPTVILSDPPTTLILIRHGQSQGNVERCFGGHSPTPLSDLGHQQAQATADFMAKAAAEAKPAERPTHIYASDLARAMQTAEPIAAGLDLPLLLAPGLRERSVGELDGKPFRIAQEERPELWKHLLAKDPHWCPPGGESVHLALERMATCLADLVARHPGGHVVLVTHAIIMHLGIHALLGHDSTQAMASYFAVSNASRSTFVVGPRRTQISGINQVEHLHLAT
jgi:probable phosphoglycerate mutase